MSASRCTRLGIASVLALFVVGAAAQAQVRSRTFTSHRCTSAQLRVKLGRAGVALGHFGQVVSFKNASRATCTLSGYPGLRMLNAVGHPIRTQVLHGIAYTVPSVRERVVTLAPGGAASFDLGYDDGTGYANERCPTSSRVEITPPNAHTPITITWRIQPYGGGSIAHLRCGQITVSPVFAPS
jgi:hypothetical protein